MDGSIKHLTTIAEIEFAISRLDITGFSNWFRSQFFVCCNIAQVTSLLQTMCGLKPLGEAQENCVLVMNSRCSKFGEKKTSFIRPSKDKEVCL